MVRAFFIIGFVVITYFIFFHNYENFDVIIDSPPNPTDVSFAPDVTEQPYQEKYDGQRFNFKDAELEPLYDFIVTGRVLSKKNYTDTAKAYIPIDIALGWGKMSDDEILKIFEFKQNSRRFYWRAKEMPIPKGEVISSASNMHLIPANEEVKEVIDSADKDDVIQLSGKLVNLSRSDGYHWKTSVSRTDSKNGACELIFVESAQIIY